MSVKRNIVLNFLSGAYCSLVGVILVPAYIAYLGTEAYGLVGFFTVCLMIAQAFDFGMAPILTRKVARCRGGAATKAELRRMLRLFETTLAVLTLLFVSLGFASGEKVATWWLNLETLSIDETARAVLLMSMIIALRLLSGLYRGAMVGFEQITFLSFYNAAVATVRSVGVLLYLALIDQSVLGFFAYQFVIALLEMLYLSYRTHRFTRQIEGVKTSTESQTDRASVYIGIATFLTLVYTNIDKILVSHFVLLSEYTFFSLSMLASMAVVIVAAPIYASVVPRITRLYAEENKAQMSLLFRQSVQAFVLFGGATAITLHMFAEPIIHLWTGDTDMAVQTRPILEYHSLGYFCFQLAVFSYYFQYAEGRLRGYLFTLPVFTVILFAGVIYGAQNAGSAGAALAWLLTNLLLVCTYSLWVNRSRNTSSPIRPTRDVILPLAAIGILQWLISRMDMFGDSRLLNAGLLIVIMLVSLGAGAALLPDLLRQRTKDHFAIARQATPNSLD